MAIVWVFAMVRVDPTLSTLTIESARSPTHEKNSLLAESESNSVSEGRQMLTCLRLSKGVDRIHRSDPVHYNYLTDTIRSDTVLSVHSAVLDRIGSDWINDLALSGHFGAKNS